MGLINCPECNKEISDQAGKCPQCGYPLKKELNDNFQGENADISDKHGQSTTVKILAVIGGVIALLVLLSGFKDLFIGF